MSPPESPRGRSGSPTTPTPGKGPLAPDDTFPCRVGDWQAMCDDFDAAAAERDRLQAENAALVAALDWALGFARCPEGIRHIDKAVTEWQRDLEQARAAPA